MSLDIIQLASEAERRTNDTLSSQGMLWVTEKHPVVDDNCIFIAETEPWGYGRGWLRRCGEPTVKKSSVPSPSEVPLWSYLWSHQIHVDSRLRST